MSTRSQIAFYETENAIPKDGDVFIYRHSDGYPEGVLPDLKPFAVVFNKHRGLDDTAYATARCVQHLTNLSSERRKCEGASEYSFLGYGVDTSIHWDIEYFYHVSPTAIKVYQPVYRENHLDDMNSSPFKQFDQWKLVKTVKLKRVKEAVS